MSISRRSIVTAAAMAGIRSSAANSAVTVGLIGCGDRGNLVSGFLVRNPAARLVALCDLYEEKVERAKRQIPVAAPALYNDYRKLLASDVDAVIIATPVYAHPEHFEAAVESGKHIYIEKPCAPDVAGCQRIIRAAGQARPGQNIAFGFQARYGTAHRKAKALLDAGAIGPLHMAHGHFIKGDVTRAAAPAVPAPSTPDEIVRGWQPWRQYSGDIIVETYCHTIDVLNWFLGGARPAGPWLGGPNHPAQRRQHGSRGRDLYLSGRHARTVDRLPDRSAVLPLPRRAVLRG